MKPFVIDYFSIDKIMALGSDSFYKCFFLTKPFFTGWCLVLTLKMLRLTAYYVQQ